MTLKTPEAIINRAVETAIETARAKSMAPELVATLESLRPQTYSWWDAAAHATGFITEGPGYANLAGTVSQSRPAKTGGTIGDLYALDLVRRVAGAVHKGSIKVAA